MHVKVYVFIYSYHKWFQTSVGFDTHDCFLLFLFLLFHFQLLLLLIVCF